MSSKKQTAVEWLKEEMKRCRTEEDRRIVFSIAKMMEKEQIKDAYEEGDGNGTATEWGYEVINAEQYYEETYGK